MKDKFYDHTVLLAVLPSQIFLGRCALLESWTRRWLRRQSRMLLVVIYLILQVVPTKN